MSHSTEKRPITSDMNEWSADLDTVLPINGEDISGFSAWVNGNGFNLKRDTHEDHDGFDFGAYLRNDGVMVLGLPKETPVRAVANGRVLQILQDLGPYACEVSIEHGAADSGMFSKYVHIDPTIKVGTEVRKGDILGSLHKDAGEVRGRLVHLHLSLVDGWGTQEHRYVAAASTYGYKMLAS